MKELFALKKPPYICAPLTGKTKKELLNQLERILLEKPDLIEWRADFFTDLSDVDLVKELVQIIKADSEVPLLFTIRAEHEGGEKISLIEEEKVALIQTVCEETGIDLVDYETSNEEKYINQIRKVVKEYQKQLVLSYHNFEKTPSNDELIHLAKKAVDYGADIVKFAVMPNSKEDVLQLLEVTKIVDGLLDKPLITMSMGDVGGLSRIVGWAYGSIITFGVGVGLSAPGQIPIQKLREAIIRTQELLPSWSK